MLPVSTVAGMVVLPNIQALRDRVWRAQVEAALRADAPLQRDLRILQSPPLLAMECSTQWQRDGDLIQSTTSWHFTASLSSHGPRRKSQWPQSCLGANPTTLKVLHRSLKGTRPNHVENIQALRDRVWRAEVHTLLTKPTGTGSLVTCSATFGSRKHPKASDGNLLRRAAGSGPVCKLHPSRGSFQWVCCTWCERCRRMERTTVRADTPLH